MHRSQRRKLPGPDHGAPPSRPQSRGQVIRFDDDERTFEPNAIEAGLAALTYHHRWHSGAGPPGSIPTQILWLSELYELGRWWARVRQVWTTSAVTEEVKYELADVVSWLAIDEGPSCDDPW